VLACVCLCAAVLAGGASAKGRAVRNWPNSPVHHLIGLPAPSTPPTFSANLRGGVAVTGNTVETCPENVSAHKKRARRPRHTRGSPRDSESCVDANNNDHNMVYVNVDPSHGHFNSSSATLTVPAGAQVVRAYLYWGADLSRGVNRPGASNFNPSLPTNGPGDDAPGGGDPQTNTLWTQAQLQVGSGAAFTTANATPSGATQAIPSWYSQPNNAPGWAYQARADVTDQLQLGLLSRTHRTRSGRSQLTVTVADVQAGRGYNRYAGWTLMVIWESPSTPFRNITLFDGFEYVQVEGGQQLVVGPLDFTGFTTPSTGPVDAQVTVWAYEGDRAITGDYLALKSPITDTCVGMPHLSDALHDPDNFFNSTISTGGVDIGGRTPFYSNQLGFDQATLALPEGTIRNGATNASVCLGTIGDTYFFGGLVFQSLIRAPNVEISKVADRSSAGPGDTVTYTTSVTNPQRSPDDPLGPTATATNVTVTDPLPSGLHFSGFIGSPPCTFNAATNTIDCDVGNLAPDGTFTYSFTATVDASAEGPAPNPIINAGCFSAGSADLPGQIFTGCDRVTVIVPPTPPPPQPADLGVVKTVSADTVAPGNALTWKVVGTNYGPATSTGFVLADQLPPGVAFVSASASPQLTCTTPPVGGNGAVTCTAPSVPPTPASGSSLTLTIVATVPADTPDGILLQNIATVRGDQPEPVPDPHPNRAETVTRVVVPDQPIPPPPPLPPGPIGPPTPPIPPPPEPPTPDVFTARLTLHKSVSPSVASQGSTVAVTLRVANITEVSALKVRVCDTLPTGLTVASAPGFHVTGRNLCKSIGTLQPVASKTLRFIVRVGAVAGSRLTNHATATASNARTVRARAVVRVTAPPPPSGKG